MARFKQFHDPELSIWQSAVGEVAAQSAVGVQTQDVGAPVVVSGRPDASKVAVLMVLNVGVPLVSAVAVSTRVASPRVTAPSVLEPS